MPTPWCPRRVPGQEVVPTLMTLAIHMTTTYLSPSMPPEESFSFIPAFLSELDIFGATRPSASDLFLLRFSLGVSLAYLTMAILEPLGFVYPPPTEHRAKFREPRRIICFVLILHEGSVWFSHQMPSSASWVGLYLALGS